MIAPVDDEASLKARLADNPRDADALGALGDLVLKKFSASTDQPSPTDLARGIAYVRDAINQGFKSPGVIERFVKTIGGLKSVPSDWNIEGALKRAFESCALNPLTFRLAVNALLHGLPQNKGAFAEALTATWQGDDTKFAELMRDGRLQDTLADPALAMIMRSTVYASAEMEVLFTAVRRYYLHLAVDSDTITVKPSDRALCYALADQCFLNEYAFWTGANEELRCDLLVESISADFAENAVKDPFSIVVVSCYRPLSSLPWAEKLTRLRPATDQNEFSALIQRHILEPTKEREIARSLPVIGEITDETSQMVKDQYEENPYPRWAMPMVHEPKPFSAAVRSRYPNADLNLLTQITKPDILVAGCGTGQQIFQTIGGYDSWDLTAIDISSASLAYAQRKIETFNLPSVNVALCDILNVSKLGKTYDIIECFGVLHHMESPIDGWRALVEVLRPGGIMSIGLYSSTARREIINAQAYARRKNYAPNPSGIRRFRQDVLADARKSSVAPASNPVTAFGPVIKSYHDFYSLSMCRDLIFHVQEKNFSLEEIKDALCELNLRFLGFKFSNLSILNSYFRRFPDDPSGTNLSNWVAYENENPTTFANMYVFDVQKPAG